MNTPSWIPEALYPAVARLARADQLTYDFGMVALAWSRGPDSEGAVSLRQVERETGTLSVEIESIRPVPPLAATLFSEAVHHLRSALDNVIFYAVEQAAESPLTEAQTRAVSMPIYDDQQKYDKRVTQLVKMGLPMFDDDATLGARIRSLQPFADDSSVSSMPPGLSAMLGSNEAERLHPLSLLRDYSNEDKHRSIRLAAARVFGVSSDDLERTRALGMRGVEVGTVLAVVTKGVLTPFELSPALHIQRPSGTWVSPGYELDTMSEFVADAALSTLLTGLVLPDATPIEVDLADSGIELDQRVVGAGKRRAFERSRSVTTAAFYEAESRGYRVAPIAAAEDVDEPHSDQR